MNLVTATLRFGAGDFQRRLDSAAMASPLGVALLGCGTVGAAVARALFERGDLLAERAGGRLELRRVVVRSPLVDRGNTIPRQLITTDVTSALASDDIDIVIELIGGLEPARGLLADALSSGRASVTANKAVIAAHGRELSQLVQPRSGGLAFEAAVAGSIPVLATLRDELRGDRVQRITAVVNGTTNVILEGMRAGSSYGAALRQAQQRGFAEADPSADVDGHDAASKLAILAWFGFNAAVTAGHVTRRGIAEVTSADVATASRLGGALRLVARAEPGETGLALSVQPTFVPHGHPLAELSAAENCLLIESDLAGTLLLRGAGAGGAATASAVLSDLVRVARARRAATTIDSPSAQMVTIADAEGPETAGMLRVGVDPGDPDATLLVAQMLEDRGVRVSGVADGVAPGELVVLTESCPRALLERAVDTLETLPAVTSVISLLDRLESAS